MTGTLELLLASSDNDWDFGYFYWPLVAISRVPFIATKISKRIQNSCHCHKSDLL